MFKGIDEVLVLLLFLRYFSTADTILALAESLHSVLVEHDLALDLYIIFLNVLIGVERIFFVNNFNASTEEADSTLATIDSLS